LGATEIETMLTLNCPILAVPDAYGLAGGASAALELHRRLVQAADTAGNRFAVIDPPPGLSVEEVVVWRRRIGIDSPSAVVYYPWLEVPALASGQSVAVP